MDKNIYVLVSSTHFKGSFRNHVGNSRWVGGIDVRKGVLGGLTPSLRLKIQADPPSWKIFEQVTP